MNDAKILVSTTLIKFNTTLAIKECILQQFFEVQEMRIIIHRLRFLVFSLVCFEEVRSSMK